MLNSIWKLAALAGLVTIGFLVVLQAQRGIPDAGNQAAAPAEGEPAAGEPPATRAGQKPGSRASDLDEALLFDQREPAAAPDFPDEDARSESIAGFESDPEAVAAGPDEGRHTPGAWDDDEAASADSDREKPPAELVVEDARPVPLEAADARSFAEHEPHPDPFASNPFGDDQAQEVVVQQRRATSTTNARSPVSQAAAESASGTAAGPQLLVPPAGGDADDVAPDAFRSGPATAELQPLPEDPGPGAPAFSANEDAEQGGGLPQSDAFEELPASEADSPSSVRLHVDEDAESVAEGAPSLDDSPAVAADPFPEFDADEAPPTVRAEGLPPADVEPEDAESAESDALRAPGREEAESPDSPAAETAEPAQLPAGGGDGQEPKPLGAAPDGAREVSLASDDLKGDGTVGADGPNGSQQPQLTIEKKAPAIAVLGKPLVYSIIVKNVGRSPAHQVVVEDRIPKGSRLTGTIPRAELIQKKLVWKLGVLKAGEEQRIAVRIVPIAEGQIGSIATVNFVSEVASRTKITAPRLELNFTGPDEARLGQTVTFTFELANRGEGLASGVYLRNIIPDELRHQAGNDLEYKIGDLKPGESRSVSLTVTAAKPGSTTNRAVVTADGGLAVESAADIEITANRLRIERTGPKRRFVGREGEFTNTIINESDESISAVAVVETVPAGLEFVKASGGGRWDAATRTVTWTISGLPPRQQQTLDVTLAGSAVGTQISEVRARTAGGDEALVSSEMQVEGVAALALSVSDNQGPIDVGDTLTLKIIAKNRGSDAASNVRVSVTVPPELEFVSARAPGQQPHGTDGQIEFQPIAELAGRSQAELEVVLKAVSGGSGDARVEIAIDADELARPLKREEAVYILPETP
jgi:uncharacterized repeat protein (TIGR01451 family)